MGFASIFAQTSSTDQTGRQITLLIIALLAVALLLAALTVWYWRYTDPRYRSDRDHRSSEAVTVRANPRVSRPLPEPEDLASTYAEEDGVSVDEWLNLTGPEALRKR